jgi:hypothetical protein
MLKITEHIPRNICTPERLIRLKKAGFDTDGQINSLESILSEKGFNLPTETTDDYERTYFGFRHDKYLKMFLNYADATAEEILFLREMKMI